MNVPIKMLGIATALLWLFLIVFSVSAALSLKDVHISFGTLQTTLISNNQLQLAFPISVNNGGEYSMRSFNITSIARDSAGRVIAQGSTFVDTINPGQNDNATHMVAANLTDLLHDDPNLLFQDSEIALEEHVSMTLAGLLPIGVITNVSVPWGAPLYNFTVENPEFKPYNATYFAATVSVCFENHAQFSFGGTIQTNMYNSADKLITQNDTQFNVTGNSPCKILLNLLLPTSNVNLSGHFEFHVSTSFMEFGPTVISYG